MLFSYGGPPFVPRGEVEAAVWSIIPTNNSVALSDLRAMTSSNFSEVAASGEVLSVDNISLSEKERSMFDSLMAEFGNIHKDQNKDSHNEACLPSLSGESPVCGQVPMEIDVLCRQIC